MALADPFGLVGQVLDGQFRVDRVVGEGGFSVVYRGHHTGLDEPIAIKCLKLPPALGSALVESFMRRFRDESRLHYRLSQGHLSIARSIASGTTMAPVTGALVPYMVLEWLEGRSLAEDFASRRAQGKTGRSLKEVVKLLDPAFDALAYAHAQGVVHRDLNPGNLFLAQTRSGVKMKVLDFGVAKVVSDHALEMGPRAPTIGQIRIFSPAYGAPEQFDDKLGKVGPWSDVYSLTLIMLESLRDQTVNEGQHLGEFAMRTLDENRPTPRALGLAVGEEVEAVMARAVSLSPDARPEDAGAFWGMLKNALRKDEDSGRGPSVSASAPPPPPAPADVLTPAAWQVDASPAPSRARTPVMAEVPGKRTLRMASAPPHPAAKGTTAAWRDESTQTQAAARPRASSAPTGGAQALAATPGTVPLPQSDPAVPLPPRRPSSYPPPHVAGAAPGESSGLHPSVARAPSYGPPPARSPSYASVAPSAPMPPHPRPLVAARAEERSRAPLFIFLAVFFVLLAGIAVAGYVLVIQRGP